MDLREFLHTVGSKYSREDKLGSEAAKLLRAAPTELGAYVTAGYRVEGSPGKGAPAFCPWVAVFDPDETLTATRGMYVVYLFAADMKTVALSLNQGVTELTNVHGAVKARALLRQQADAIYQALPVEMVGELDQSIDLAAPARADLARSYEAGNIAARTYDLSALPSDANLRDDLAYFIHLYGEALATRKALTLTTSNTIHTRESQPAKMQLKQPRKGFAPKNQSDYLAHVQEHTQVKSRKHETLIEMFGKFMVPRGFHLESDVHPRDMTIDTPAGQHWLAEVKIVYKGKAAGAVREALAQLMEYEYFFYEGSVSKLALFNQDVGPMFVEYLEAKGIAVMWMSHNEWKASPLAIKAGFL
jgi:hypothetical protein